MILTSASFCPPDCWLRVRVYYCDTLVKEVTTKTAEGCRITYRPVPADNVCLYGSSGLEQVLFPSLDASAGGRATGALQRLLPHLHRGILLWVAPEGVFMKRQCQGRVYWKGPLAPHENQPNKLEREKTYKLLDTQQFLQREYYYQAFLLGIVGTNIPKEKKILFTYATTAVQMLLTQRWKEFPAGEERQTKLLDYAKMTKLIGKLRDQEIQERMGGIIIYLGDRCKQMKTSAGF
uniref:Interferon regulatory factor-3 domain-containing protein n=1 Tax=Podarcis muralis TaxID=64176 RepID=A0A670ID33_PODMU